MKGNPGQAKRLARKTAAGAERALHKRLAGWARAKKGSRGYYAWRHRRRAKDKK